MTVPQLYSRIEFWLDRVKSPRFQAQDGTFPDYDNSINNAIEDFINNRTPKQPNGNPKVFTIEEVQRIKDELYTIVKSDSPIVPVNDNFPIPADYRMELGFSLIISGQKTSSIPISHNEKDSIAFNSFTAPSDRVPRHYQDNNGITVLHGTGTFTQALYSYLQKPAVVMSGLPLTTLLTPAPLTIGINYTVVVGNVTYNSIVYTANTGTNNFTAITGFPIFTGAGTVVQTLVIGQVYAVFSGVIVYNGITYTVGQQFTVIAGLYLQQFTGSGTLKNIVNCNLPELTHNEICKRASLYLLYSVRDMAGAQLLETLSNQG